MEWKIDYGKSALSGDEQVWELELGLNFYAAVRLAHPGVAEWRIVFRSYDEETVLFSGVEDSLVDARRVVQDSWAGYVQSLCTALHDGEERKREIARSMMGC